MNQSAFFLSIVSCPILEIPILFFKKKEIIWKTAIIENKLGTTQVSAQLTIRFKKMFFKYAKRHLFYSAKNTNTKGFA